MTTNKIKKILIANRGEIAVRIIKACQEMGLKTVAVYSEADAEARHVRLADETVAIGPPAPTQSYLQGTKLIAAAQKTGCQAIHPGYGFLSENAAFVEAVQEAGLIFIGPDAASIRQMGTKTAAREIMEKAGVPVVPGYNGGGSLDEFITAAADIGYPVLAKAAAGGGGKGMRIVYAPEDLVESIKAAQREAKNAFGDDEIYLEKYIEQPHHVEFQILADRHGTTLHLFERECSIQRRHQKIIEETPSPLLNEALRQKMAKAAIEAARAVNYVNAGTIEFLVDEDGHFYFLEMNTRLQVEHPITELVTGIDLVQAQLLVAAGEPLPFKQSDIIQRGHALECRVYAEDAANQFLPSIGPVLQAIEPTGNGIRVDSGVSSGDKVTVHYDPMIAKVIVYAHNRAAAIQKMDYALKHYAILGVKTNIPFLRALLAHPSFGMGKTTTHFIQNHFANWQFEQNQPPDIALIAAALFERLHARETAGKTASPGSDPYNPWLRADQFRIGGTL